MNTVYVLVGMIGSGKSTYARRLAEGGALVICHDDLCHMLHAGALVGPGNCGYDPDLRECYRQMEESLVWVALNAGRSVVVDRTHLTWESRFRWIRLGRDFFPRSPKPSVVAVVFPIELPEIHALRRCSADPRGRTLEEWLKVARHHHDQAQAEPLSEDEGFTEIRHVGPDLAPIDCPRSIHD